MLNRCSFIGNLGRDPEVRHTGNGTTICNFSIACTEKWKDKQGQQQERTEWVRVSCFGKLAEICGQYLAKGKQVYVEGKMQTREYEKDGSKRYSTEINAHEVKFLGARDNQAGNHGGVGTGGAAGPGNSDRGGDSYGYFDNMINGGGGGGNDDIPFARRDY